MVSVTETDTTPRLSRFAAAALCFVIPFPFGLLLGWAVWAFYHRIDAGGQGLRGFVFLFGFKPSAVAPSAIIALLLLGPAIHFLLRGSRIGPWRSAATAVVVMLSFLFCAFGYVVYHSRLYLYWFFHPSGT